MTIFTHTHTCWRHVFVVFPTSPLCSRKISGPVSGPCFSTCVWGSLWWEPCRVSVERRRIICHQWFSHMQPPCWVYPEDLKTAKICGENSWISGKISSSPRPKDFRSSWNFCFNIQKNHPFFEDSHDPMAISTLMEQNLQGSSLKGRGTSMFSFRIGGRENVDEFTPSFIWTYKSEISGFRCLDFPKKMYKTTNPLNVLFGKDVYIYIYISLRIYLTDCLRKTHQQESI